VVEADAKAALRGYRGLQQCAEYRFADCAAVVADGEARGVGGERHVDLQIIFHLTLEQRVVEQIVGHAVEQRGWQQRFGVRLVGRENDRCGGVALLLDAPPHFGRQRAAHFVLRFLQLAQRLLQTLADLW